MPQQDSFYPLPTEPESPGEEAGGEPWNNAYRGSQQDMVSHRCKRVLHPALGKEIEHHSDDERRNAKMDQHDMP